MNLSKIPFSKVYTPIEEQISLLKTRGLVVHDQTHALQILNTVSYYRLSAYFKPYLIRNSPEHQFKPNIQLQDIWDLYLFDRELRLITTDALERIEIALRTAMINVMAKYYNDDWYLQNEPFKEKWFQEKSSSLLTPKAQLMKEINRACQQKNEDFLRHYFTKYNHPPYPPSWMMLECLSFGSLTSLFRHIAKKQIRKEISEILGHHPTIIESLLELLRFTRNLCAHHSRLWNRWFLYTIKDMETYRHLAIKKRTFHEVAFVLNILLKKISPDSLWLDHLYQLFEQHPQVPFFMMGFADHWKEDPFWNL